MKGELLCVTLAFEKQSTALNTKEAGGNTLQHCATILYRLGNVWSKEKSRRKQKKEIQEKNKDFLMRTIRKQYVARIL